MHQRAINLGKRLVRELELESGNDTLSCWMAHYLGEQISTAEAAEGNEKEIAEQRCYETVLKLWMHRASLPNGHHPYEGFEPIFRALDGLDPECQGSFYFHRPSFYKGQDSTDAPECDDVQQWVDVALSFDQTARILIGFAFQQAALCASDENTKAWIQNEIDLKNAGDRSVVVRLLPFMEGDNEEDELERIREEQETILKSRVEKLEAFSKFSRVLQEALLGELEKISLDDT